MDQEAVCPVQKKFNWKIPVAIAVALALVVGLVLVLASLGNSKTSPLKAVEKYTNAKTVRLERMYKDLLAGSDGGNFAKIISLMRKSDTFNSMIETQEESFADLREDKLDEYGKNYRASIKNNRKDEERLEKQELRAYRDDIRAVGEQLYELGKTLGKLDKDELEDMADKLDMSVNDLKAMIKCVRALGEKYKKAEVSDGYVLSVTTRITGSELDEPEEDDEYFVVLKVNGKWVSESAMDFLSTLYYQLHYAA